MTVAAETRLHPVRRDPIRADVRDLGKVLFARPGASGRGEASLALEVWRLAWPAITHYLLLTLVFLVDRLVIGNYSAVALASLQISSILVWTCYAIFTALSTGTLAIVGRSVGAGDVRGAAKVAAASMGASFVLGIVVAVSVLAFAGSTLPRLFPQAGDAVLADAVAYLDIVLLTLPLAFVEASAAASLQAAGDTKTPLYAAVVSNVLNLVLALTLVFGAFGLPRLGIRGAAIGTAVATVAQAVILVVALHGKNSKLPLREPDVRRAVFDLEVIRRLIDVSGSAFVEKVGYQGGYLLFVMIIGWLGQTAMAANQALTSIESVCFLSADGLGVAAGALVAQKLGAGRPEEAERAARIATFMAVAMLGFFGLVFALVPGPLIRAFSDDPEIIGVGTRALYVAAIAQPFMAFATVMRMSLRGAGATTTVLLVTIAGTFFVRLPVSYFAAISLGWGLLGVWVGSTAHWAFETVVLRVMFARGTWKTKRV
jgi:putative MATE family efflux protein